MVRAPYRERKQILQLKKNYETKLLSESKSEVDYCFPSLGKINRTLKNIEDAEVKLDNNNDQINSALFWFYTGRMSTDYSAFEALKLGNTNQAMDILVKPDYRFNDNSSECISLFQPIYLVIE